MKFSRVWLVGVVVAALPGWAIYAPIPEQQQGKAWTVSLKAGVMHDSNIFGAQSGAIDSMIYSFSPKFDFNASVTDQTFLAASYKLALDHFIDRPGDKTLDSHDFMGRLAHEFSPGTNIDISNIFTIQKNPEALLPGLAAGANPTVANSDQSFRRNEINGRFNAPLGARASVSLKVRNVIYRYDAARLGTNLDRIENLYGLSGEYSVLPETKAVVEYRHQTIDYRNAGESKDKTSNFGLVGVDHTIAKKISASARLGFEYRKRVGERSDTAPYAELSTKHDYAEGSFLSGGYVYTFEESSNVATYTDTQVNRFFVNLQHAVTPRITASGSFNYEPSQLRGRRGFADADETTVRYGVALSYLPNKNWVVSSSYDHDRVRSDDASRGMKRNRLALGATYTF